MQLKLYVWLDVLNDYTPGMVCVLPWQGASSFGAGR